MNLVGILEKQNIKFPRPISLEEAEEFLAYVANMLPGSVNYHVGQYKNLIHDTDSGEIIKDSGSISIQGMIRNSKETMGFDDFLMGTSEEDYTRLGNMSFHPVPGWGLEDYRPEVRKLWSDVKRLASYYFRDDL